MATTVAAETAGHPAEKEKVEKRRALGRGLESLLPGPRVVPGAAGAGVAPRQGVPSPGSGAAEKTEIPHFVRDDNTKGDDKAHSLRHDYADVGRDANALSATSVVDVRAVVEMDAATRTEPALSPPKGVSAPPVPAEGIEIHAQAEGRAPSNLVLQLPLDQIDANPHQTRYDFDQENLEELAYSIKANGVVQPVVVRPGEEGRYVLVLGERRCRASKLAGKTTVPAIGRRGMGEQGAQKAGAKNPPATALHTPHHTTALR